MYLMVKEEYYCMKNSNINFFDLVIISKPLDFVNFVDINPNYKKSFYIVLNFIGSDNYKIKIIDLFNMYEINDTQYQFVSQIDLYFFPFIKTFFINKEEKVDFSNIQYESNLKSNLSLKINSPFYKFLNIFNRPISFILYKLIRFINRKLFKLYSNYNNKIVNKLSLDPHPYKLMHIDLIKFNKIQLFDGGRSTVSFNILSQYDGNLNSVIDLYRSSKYKYLLSKSLSNKMSNIESKFYTRYSFNDLKKNFIIKIKDNFDFSNLNIDQNSVLVLSANLPELKTKVALKNIQLYLPNKKIFYRPHPRENKFNKIFKEFSKIKFIKPISTGEIDYFKLRMKLSNSIVHWNSSFISVIEKNKNINLIHYNEIEKNFNHSP